MIRKISWRQMFIGLSASLALAGSPAFALIDSSNRDIVSTPNVTEAPTGGVFLNGQNFINRGLQGVGRVAATAKDPVTGESLGSISDMQITGFTRNADGTYKGVFNFLPDRGYNSDTVFSNYAARINTFDFTFTPYTSTASTTAQDQIKMTFTGSQRFTYDHDKNAGTPGVYTTGMLATGVGTLLGKNVPVTSGNTTQSDGTVTGRLTVDAEGLVLDSRAGKAGSGWISDEYGASIYHFNDKKEIDGVLAIPDALVPHKPANTINYNGTPTNGRRDNQGFEGLAQSGDKLFALLQSATIQDSGSGNQGRANAVRLLQYDISAGDAPPDPIRQYVIQLPRVDTDLNGSVDRTAAQSSIIALNDHQLLILSRDGNGRGANTGTPVFKSILLADLNDATNIDGQFDATGNAVAPGGTLNVNVKPIQWTEALNLLGKVVDPSKTELERFGLNLLANNGDENTLSEKWEGMALVSAQDPNHPDDYFLFVGNDNDFLTKSGKYLDSAGNLQSYDAGLENDTMVLVYRVTIIPEPASLGVLGSAAGALAMLARRRGR